MVIIAPGHPENRVWWTFNVDGKASPKGSKRAGRNRHTGKLMLIESAHDDVKAWQNAVIAAVWEQTQSKPEHTEVGETLVDIWFWLRRPKSVPKRRLYPITKPDRDKLERSTHDALVTARLVADDALITDGDIHKRYVHPGRPQPGATVFVARILGLDPETQHAII